MEWRVWIVLGLFLLLGELAAAAILAIADATAKGIRKAAEAIQQPSGFEAMQLRVVENYLGQFGKLAQEGNTMILAAILSDVGSMISLAMNIGRRQGTAADGATQMNR